MNHLWKSVKPGGYYFIEDLYFSYRTEGGGDPTGGKDFSVRTTMQFIYELMDDLMINVGWDWAIPPRHEMSKEIYAIDCVAKICGLTKKLPEK